MVIPYNIIFLFYLLYYGTIYHSIIKKAEMSYKSKNELLYFKSIIEQLLLIIYFVLEKDRIVSLEQLLFIICFVLEKRKRRID
jgi:hypothetical protein